MAHSKTDVIIVGAGPTGLMMASLLARCGVHFRILDHCKDQVHESRAFGVHAKSLELFQNIGLVDKVLDRGTLGLGVQFILNGMNIANVNFDDFGEKDTPYPFALLLPQSETENILVEDLNEHGIKIERGVEVTSVRQNGNEVQINILDRHGAHQQLKTSYLVGADGAHSIVRRSLGLEFNGGPYLQNFLLADCEVSWPWDFQHPKFFIRGRSFALYFPLQGKRLGRIITVLPNISTELDQGPAKSVTAFQPVSLKEVEEGICQASGVKVKLSNAVWTARYRVHHRMVNQYSVGRVFLAGDAAHIHSPVGAQGMNTGLQDAANLAWKLALVIQGRATPKLLDTYDLERRPIGQKLLDTTDRLFARFSPPSFFATLYRNAVLPILPYLLARSPKLRKRMFHFLSGLGIHYRGNDFLMGHQAGKRAPNASITENFNLFTLLQDYQFHVLALARRPLTSQEIHHTVKELSSLPKNIGIPIQAHFIGHRLGEHDPRMIDALSTEIFTRYGVDNPEGTALFLIRPDGHIAFHAPGLEFQRLKIFLSRFQTTRFMRHPKKAA